MGEQPNKEEPKVEEEKKVEEEPKPPPPFVLFVDMHCTGCAKKIEKSILKIRGVEGVVIDMLKNEVTIKGIVEPQAICNKITKITKRVARVLSPLPPAEGQPIPQLVNSQVSGMTVVELNVNMHCEACAQQLKKKILKMRGVQTAETELSTGKVVVRGTMDGEKLVEYVYRRTKKQAKIVPQPESPKEEEAEAQVKAEDEKKESEESTEKQEEEKKPAREEEKEGEKQEKENEDIKKEEEINNNNNMTTLNNNNIIEEEEEEESMKRMMMYQYYQQHPLYVIERIPPPQLFSDENPNACCIL